jgi:hypothetical protein
VCDLWRSGVSRPGRRWGAALLRLMRLVSRRLPWHWLTVTAVIGFEWMGIGLTLWHDHTAARKGGDKESANLARLLDESITRTVEAVDQTLLFIREGYQKDHAAYASQAWAQSRSFLNDLHLQISIVDRNGRATWSNLGPANGDVNIADREHFRFQQASRDDTLFISQPVIGRRSNRWSIQFVRTLLAPDGSFDGVAVVSLDPNYLARFYESIAIGDGSIFLANTNGTILVHVPASSPLIGRQMPPDIRAGPD